MNCPNCDTESSRTIDSRSVNAGKAVRRRRLCPICRYRWTTWEHVEHEEAQTLEMLGQLVASEIRDLADKLEKNTKEQDTSVDHRPLPQWYTREMEEKKQV